MKRCLIFCFPFVFNLLNSQNAFIYYLNGDTMAANIQPWNVSRDMITARVKNKKKDLPADSLLGFKIDGEEYLALKASYMDHHQFCIKVKTLEEFNIYGWQDIILESSSSSQPSSKVSFSYEYVKRPRDNRSYVFKFDRDGLSQIPLLNCQPIMDSLLKKAGQYDDMKELVDAYDRDCGVITRSR